MSLRISLPESLRAFVRSRLETDFASADEYIRALIRRDREEQALLLTDRGRTATSRTGAVRGLRELRGRLLAERRGLTLEELRRAVDEGSGL